MVTKESQNPKKTKVEKVFGLSKCSLIMIAPVYSVLLPGSWGLNNPNRPLASILTDWRSP